MFSYIILWYYYCCACSNNYYTVCMCVCFLSARNTIIRQMFFLWTACRVPPHHHPSHTPLPKTVQILFTYTITRRVCSSLSDNIIYLRQTQTYNILLHPHTRRHTGEQRRACFCVHDSIVNHFIVTPADDDYIIMCTYYMRAILFLNSCFKNELMLLNPRLAENNYN